MTNTSVCYEVTAHALYQQYRALPGFFNVNYARIS